MQIEAISVAGVFLSVFVFSWAVFHHFAEILRIFRVNFVKASAARMSGLQGNVIALTKSVKAQTNFQGENGNSVFS